MSFRIGQRQNWQAVTLLMALMGIFCACLPQQSFAFQDESGETETTSTPTEDTAKSEDTTSTEEETPAAPKNESVLTWIVKSSGWFGAVLLIMSFIMVAVIMMNVLQVRRDNLLPEEFVAAFEEKLTAKDYQGAYEISRGDESLIARVLAAGLGRLNRGYAEAIEGMQEVGEEESMMMEHRLSYLALIGSIAPMIGLAGTVYGMILSFYQIKQSVNAPRPNELADGISTALITTLEGLIVAIPAIVAYSLLRNRVSRLLLEVGRVSEGLMGRFSAVGKTTTEKA